jgi:hypothetical protein
LLSLLTFSQEKFTLSGYVKDKESGETLISATVAVPDAKTGANTNAYGFYSITLPKGKYKIVSSYVGYKSFEKEINLENDLKLDIELEPQGAISEEIVVTGKKANENVNSVEMSSIELSTSTIKKIPALLGEVDVIKSVQLLPGVSTVGEGATGFNVRGGSIDQNLVLLDEAPVYNQSHLFGLFSVFNPDAVKDVKLIKGGIPSPYGGRLSSILDVRLKEGSDRITQGTGGVGTIFSRLEVEGPIVEDKASFLIAGRRSYIDVLARPFLEGSLSESDFYFYDLTAKLNWKIDDRNTVFVSGFFGRDVFGSGGDVGFEFDWGSQTATVRWNHLFSDKLFSNFTYYFSNYDYSVRFGQVGVDAFELASGIQNQSLKYDFQYFIEPGNNLSFGAEGIYYNIIPGQSKAASNGVERVLTVPDKFGLESAVYIDHEYEINEKFSIRYGARGSFYGFLGPTNYFEFGERGSLNPKLEVLDTLQADDFELIDSYMNFEPRFSIKYQINEASSIKASYNRMAQYVHLLSNTAAATPVDQWYPTTNVLQPELADQVALGYFRNFNDNAWESSVEVYYKDLQNQLDFIPSADLGFNESVESDLLVGIGRAYGVEFFLKKNVGKLTGFLSYTLSRSERRVEGINNGDWYPTRFDQTHNVNLTLSYDLTEKWSFSSNFVYNTGTPASFPTNGYFLQGVTFFVPHTPGGERNQNRIPDYHRIDLSATYKPYTENDAWWKGQWVFSIYNLYARRNAFSIYPSFNLDTRQPEFIRFSLLGSIVPSITYNFDFDISKLTGN